MGNMGYAPTGRGHTYVQVRTAVWLWALWAMRVTLPMLPMIGMGRMGYAH
jgi:hypothetical protein